MNTFRQYKFIFLILIIFSFGCSKSEENIPADIEIQDFVWKGLNAYYLWQSQINDLQDTRFSSQSQLNNYLTGFQSPENLFESLLNRPTDRFSVMRSESVV